MCFQTHATVTASTHTPFRGSTIAVQSQADAVRSILCNYLTDRKTLE